MKSISRRGWWKGVAGAIAGAGVVSAASVEDRPKDRPDVADVQEYLGFTCRWTGWKDSMQDLGLSGQWTARKKDGSLLIGGGGFVYSGVVSCFPGNVKFFSEGEQFNTLAVSQEQIDLMYPQVEFAGSKEKQHEAKMLALRELRRFLREKSDSYSERAHVFDWRG